MNKRLSNQNATYTAPVASKTLKVLERILTAPHNPGLTEIASDLSLAKSTTHGILAALEESGWVVRDPLTRQYTCGHLLKDLVVSAEVRIPLIHQARPFLKELAAELDEDVFLGMFTPHYLLILDQVESSKKLKVSTRPGTRLSIFAGASGKIFLAYEERERVVSLVHSTPLPQFTPRSITDPDRYLAELDRVRQEGVAFDTEEYIPGVRAVAVPIFHGRSNRKRMVAGLWVVGLSSSFDEEKMKTASHRARDTGAAISKKITP
jgi:DNA-binding IclR family transcriptional regulator